MFQNAGQVLQEIAKDRPSQKQVDLLTQQVMGSIKSVDGKLSDQVTSTSTFTLLLFFLFEEIHISNNFYLLMTIMQYLKFHSFLLFLY